MPALQTQHDTGTTVVTGTVERILFQKESDGYCVLSIRPKNKQDSGLSDLHERITAVGNIPTVRVDDEYEITGAWKNHPRFGRQLQIQDYELLLPATEQGIIRFLASIATGIGPVKAQRIVDALGTDCLDKIQDDPECLRRLSFVTADQVAEITDYLAGNKTQSELASMICRQGITPSLAAKIYGIWGADSIQKVKEDPYALTDVLWGVGFKIADQIAGAVGIEPDSPFRIRAGVRYVLQEARNEGHCYLRPSDIVPAVQKLLGAKVDVSAISSAVSALIEAELIVREGNAVYDVELHRAEVLLARYVSQVVGQSDHEWSGLETQIEGQQKRNKIEFAPEQKEAIARALTSPLSVVTGGPGVGKSTIIRTITDLYESEYPDHDIYLASPTGRAAQRITETSGRPAQTIHRLLAYSPADDGFAYNEYNQLPGPGLLIVDEFSMCDVELARHLFAAIPDDLQVVLVGDIDQLPSVGPGSVLRDLIDCGQIPVTRLRFNYRQAGGSKIAEYANLIATGQTIRLADNGDFEWQSVDTPDDAATCTSEIVRKALQSGLSIMDVQVLAPMYRGDGGISRLNKMVRDIYLGPPDKDTRFLGQFRLRDKVLVTRNNYELGVFNGDLGQVTDLRKGSLTVRMADGRQVNFGGDDLDILTQAYAVSVHKAQGSEFPLVVLVLLRHHYIMLQRNLLYTGMTRAKERLVLVGHDSAVRRAIGNSKVEARYSLLRDRIQIGRSGFDGN